MRRFPRAGIIASDWAICVGLLAAVLGVYAQVAGFDFLNYDDDIYVATNDLVRRGLSWEGLWQAFTTAHVATWHPLTTLSHMADYSVFGLWAGGHHLVSVAFHACNTVGLFVVLRLMTGARWRSAFVAAMFGLHPLHVESVAWVSERKDVLSTFFWMLTVTGYWHYVQAPSRRRYVLMAGAYTLALLGKPMVVTLPVLLVLLDVWPLGRLAIPSWSFRRPGEATAGRGGSSLHALVREKIPLFALAGTLGVVTIAVQGSVGAMVPLKALPLSIRLANVPVSYVRYLGKMLWPANLAVLYPYEYAWPVWQVVAAAALLAGLTLVCSWLGARHRYAFVGWWWFIAALLPVVGLFQAGVQAMADRFTYVPLIGLFILAAWGAHAAAGHWRHGVPVLAGVALLVVAACVPLTWAQVRHWRNSYTVFEHALAVTRGNAVAHEYLGKALLADGRLAEAAEHFEKQVHLVPFLSDARLQLGLLLAQLGRLDDAAAQTAQARRMLPPDAAGAFYNLGNVEARQEKFDEAVMHYRMALLLAPEWPEAHHNLGIALASIGKGEEALAEYDEAVRLRPDFAEAYVSRGAVLAEQGRTEEAIAAYVHAIALRPTLAVAHRNAAMALAQLGRTQEARTHLEAAIRLAPDDADARAQLQLLDGTGAPAH